MNQPRILQITHALAPQALGGVELYALECARSLGGAVFSLTSSLSPDPAWNGFTVSTPRSRESPRRALARTLDEFRPQAVLVQHLGAASPGLLELLSERQVPHAIFLHDCTQLCPTHKLWHRRETPCGGPGRTGWKCAWCVSGSPSRWVELPARLVRYQHRPEVWQRAMSRATVLVAETRYLRDFWIEQGAPPERITVLPVVMPSTAPPPAAAPRMPRRLFYGGGLGSAKGADLLAAALERIGDPVELALAGRYDGAAAGMMRALVPAHHDLRWCGALTHAALVAELAASAAAVMPSRWQEAYGRIVHEAQLNETPAVATAVGGLPERIVHGINGFLAAPDDAGSLAAAIEDAFDARASGWDPQPARRQAMDEAEQAKAKLHRLCELLATGHEEPALGLDFPDAVAEPQRGRLIAALRAVGDEQPLTSLPEQDAPLWRRAWSATRLRQVHLNHALAFFQAAGCRAVLDPGVAWSDANAAFAAWGIAAGGRPPDAVFVTLEETSSLELPNLRRLYPQIRAVAWASGPELQTSLL